MKQVGEHGSGTRGRLLPRFAALGVLAAALMVPWQVAQAAETWDPALVACGDTTPTGKLNCTSNDSQGITVTPRNIPTCTEGQWVDVTVDFLVNTTGGNTRYDIGAWFRSDVPGQCQNRFTTVGTGGFTNLEGGPPSDTCGDLSGTATQSFTVKVLCQPDADGKVPVATTAYWAQSSNGATCNAYPSTAAKCANITAMAQVESVVGSITVNKIANGGSFGFEIAGGTVSDSSFDLAGGASKTVTATAAIAGTQYTIPSPTYRRDGSLNPRPAAAAQPLSQRSAVSR